MTITGATKIIAHLGYPTESFKAPMIYNPYFAKQNIDAIVVPMGCTADNYADFFRGVAKLSNFLGALITMPHKVTTVTLLDEATTAVKVAGSCNAVKRDKEGLLVGDMFDGDGFVRGVLRKGRNLSNASALILGCGGVGSAIAASLAKAGAARLGLVDIQRNIRDRLWERLRSYYPGLALDLEPQASDFWDVIVNATPLGMKPDDPLPLDLSDVPSSSLIGEVVMTRQFTPFLEQARTRGCEIQTGLDMLYEQIPAYLEFFGLPTTTSEELRIVAGL